MQQSGTLVYKAQTIKQAKNELANKIAQLNEYNCQRNQLQHRLFDLANHVKSLKNQQYDLHKGKVNLECQRVQLVQASEETTQEIALGKTVIMQINEELEDHGSKSMKVMEKIASLKRKKEQMEGRIAQRGIQSKRIRKQIEEVRQREASLKQLQGSREEIIVKMKESQLYLTQKSQQQQNNQTQMRRLHNQEQDRSLTIQTQIKDAHARLQEIQEQKINQKREVIKEEEQISSQQLRNKVLLQKLEIMRQRLTEVQEEQTYSQHLLQMKENSARELQQRKSLKQEKWNLVKQRIAIELQYARYCCQKNY